MEFSTKRFRHYQTKGTTTATLEQLLRRCRDNDIEVVLYGTPCTSFFRTNFTPEIDAAYSAYIEHLTQTYGCRFIDYRDALPDQCFADMLHYNPSGGRIFTCRLTREIISPWLGGSMPDMLKGECVTPWTIPLLYSPSRSTTTPAPPASRRPATRSCKSPRRTNVAPDRCG